MLILLSHTVPSRANICSFNLLRSGAIRTEQRARKSEHQSPSANCTSGARHASGGASLPIVQLDSQALVHLVCQNCFGDICRGKTGLSHAKQDLILLGPRRIVLHIYLGIALR